MGMQGFFPAHPVNEKGLYHVYLEFMGNNGAAPNVNSYYGPLINTITRDSEGVYDLDLVCKDAISRIVAARATVNDTSTGVTNAESVTVHVDETPAAGCTIKVIGRTGSTSVVDDLDGKRIFVELVFRPADSATSYT